LRCRSWRPLFAFVVSVCCSGACAAGSEDQPRVSPPPPRNLLLVTIDTLRADRVGSYGYASASTPALDELARSGVRFTRAYAPTPITLPSHATLMTGLNPPAHGARHNGLRPGDDAPVMAAALEEAGFATAAFVSAFPLDRRFGLARGFDVYDDQLPRRADGRSENERRGSVTVDAALSWLQQHRETPFFLWVHLFEPHAPYGDPATTAATVSDRYDAEISEADRQLARLLAALGNARTSTLVVAAADHGEAFGEHGEIGHSLFIYDVTLRVPLILNGPGVPADGRAIDRAVGLVDIAPTIRALFNRPATASDGIDLRRAIDGTAPANRMLYAESFAPLIDFGWSPLRAIRAGKWKYIAAPRAELYDLASDAGETRNEIAQQADEGQRLAQQVAAISPPSLARAPQVRPDEAARLGALGYVSRPGRSGGDAAARPDPKDRKEIAARLAEITSGEIAGERLVPALEALLRDDPGNPHAELRLGVALVDRGECGRADKHLRAAIQSGVPSADPFISLGFCHRQRGETAAATRALEEADRIEPGNPVVAANLGLFAFDAGRMRDAVTRLEAAVTRDPDLHEARFFLARAYARLGEREAAHRHAVTLLSRLPAAAPQRPEVERLVAALR
jgi:choline-sulfatase